MTRYSSFLVQKSVAAQEYWRTVPAPRRGALLKELSRLIADDADVLASLITLESKKIIAESEGEVQEMIDICDFAVGLSRQLYGLTMPSERQDHRIQELWHPLGVVGVITAFNFPMAVWAWNHALAIVCGNSVIWKPSPRAEACADACKTVWDTACELMDEPRAKDLLLIFTGGNEEAVALANDPQIALLSATGSTEMGKALAPLVAARLGKCLYELGGNNAMIVTQNANLELAIRAIVFSAVGTAGQRCTTLRRLIVHSSIYDTVLERLKSAYNLKKIAGPDGPVFMAGTMKIGDPRDPSVLIGPLIDEASAERARYVLGNCRAKGYAVHGGTRLPTLGEGFMAPAIVEVTEQCELVQTETFAPILYIMKYETLQEAIELQNGVRQGLSSCIFTENFKEAELFISAAGSDCGIANVNIGPSGAEIGGAFGGEKDTGGGRESGSDAWKAYMRRQTVTVNYGNDLPLAQGVSFDV